MMFGLNQAVLGQLSHGFGHIYQSIWTWPPEMTLEGQLMFITVLCTFTFNYVSMMDIDLSKKLAATLTIASIEYMLPHKFGITYIFL